MYYWKSRTSGIYGSEFRNLWDAVLKKIGADSSKRIDLSGDSPEPESRFAGESDNVTQRSLERTSGWANLWTKGAELFQFDDCWDEEKMLLRKSAGYPQGSLGVTSLLLKYYSYEKCCRY